MGIQALSARMTGIAKQMIAILEKDELAKLEVVVALCLSEQQSSGRLDGHLVG